MRATGCLRMLIVWRLGFTGEIGSKERDRKRGGQEL